MSTTQKQKDEQQKPRKPFLSVKAVRMNCGKYQQCVCGWNDLWHG